MDGCTGGPWKKAITVAHAEVCSDERKLSYLSSANFAKSDLRVKTYHLNSSHDDKLPKVDLKSSMRRDSEMPRHLPRCSR